MIFLSVSIKSTLMRFLSMLRILSVLKSMFFKLRNPLIISLLQYSSAVRIFSLRDFGRTVFARRIVGFVRELFFVLLQAGLLPPAEGHEDSLVL